MQQISAEEFVRLQNQSAIPFDPRSLLAAIPQFEPVDTGITGVIAQFSVTDNTARVQFFLDGATKYPATMGPAIVAMTKRYPALLGVIVDYVAEPGIQSWYLQFTTPAGQPTRGLVESMLKRLAASV